MIGVLLVRFAFYIQISDLSNIIGAAAATLLAAFSSVALAVTMLLPKHAIFDRGQSLLCNVFLRSGLWLRLATIRELLSTSLALLAGYTLNTATYSAGSIIAAKSFPNALNPPQWLSGLPFLPRSLGLSVTTSVASHQATYRDKRNILREIYCFAFHA